LNLVDSSGWLEYFFDHPNASFFRSAIEDLDDLIVPTIVLFEVYRTLLRELGEAVANQCVATMNLGNVVNLDHELALSAAATAHEEKLAMADAIILATSRFLDATLWTQDADLGSFAGVKFKAKH
jgi:predicted nucleic acid-binding protein